MHIVMLNWKDLAHPAAGGAEVYTEEIARRWVADGHRVTIVCAAVEGRPTFESVDGVDIVRGGGRFGVYRQARSWVSRQSARDVDLVIDQINTRPFLTPRWLPRALPGVPYVGFAHQVCRDIWPHEMPLPVALAGRYVLEPSWLRSYRRTPVLAPSPSSLDSLRSYGLTDLHLVPEGVNVPALPSYPKFEQPTVLFCGRLVTSKRADEAVEAFTLAKASSSALAHARMLVVGGGPLLEQLRSRGAQDVEFLGRVSAEDKWRIMAQAHLLVATSVREGWGLVVSEAAAVGTPAAAYDVPGLRDAVPAAGGVLTDATPAALAAAISTHLPRFVAHPPAALPHGGACSWDEVAARFLHVAMDAAGLNPSDRVRTGAR